MRALPLFLLVLLFGLTSDLRAQDRSRPRGVVLGFAGVDGGRVNEALRRETMTEWTYLSIRPAPTPLASRSQARLAELEEAYYAANFARCREVERDPDLRLDHLLTQGWRERAGRKLLLAAACALAMEDRTRSAQHLRQLVTLALHPSTSLAGTSPELKGMLDHERRSLAGRASKTLALRLSERADRVAIDGKEVECTQPKCSFELAPGRHFVHATALARASWQGWVDLERTSSISIFFARMSADEVQMQLAGKRPGAAIVDTPYGLPRVAASFDAERAIVLWREGSSLYGMAYREDSRPKIRRAQVAEGAEGLLLALLQVQEGERKKLVRRRWILAGVGAAAAVAAGLTAFFLLRPSEPRRDFVFP